MIPSAPAHSILPRLLLGAARGPPAAPATPVARGLVALVAFRSPFAALLAAKTNQSDFQALSAAVDGKVDGDTLAALLEGKVDGGTLAALLVLLPALLPPNSASAMSRKSMLLPVMV